MSRFRILILSGCFFALLSGLAEVSADVKLPSLFGSHMVLQRDHANPVWGWADPGETVSVSIADQTHSTKAGDDGRWRVTLKPLEAGGPHTLTINDAKLDDVLVGEVWVCSGQSNMQWSVNVSDDAELEIAASTYPNIRLITVPQLGVQEPQDDFNGEWTRCSPETVPGFSAVGYFFGRQLHQTLDVPIGLIDNAWGGSACEAWVRRDLLEASPDMYQPLLDRWAADEQKLNELAAKSDLTDGQTKALSNLKRRLAGQHRPANLYCGVLHPIIGYGIRGTIWYQGETNAARAYQYRDLFPLMIQSWREEWGQGDFPFYWVQLADFRNEVTEPAGSSWAELREAQTMTMKKLPNTGEAVIIDIGEGRDIHPRDKQNVAKRLARWALAKDYGLDISHQSPTYQSMEIRGNKAVVTFDHVGKTLYSFDTRDVVGFAIAGEDRKFVNANARIVGKEKVEVWSDSVSAPVAVRYAWADNPICNLESREGLPATPFRTDDWPGVTAEAK